MFALNSAQAHSLYTSLSKVWALFRGNPRKSIVTLKKYYGIPPPHACQYSTAPDPLTCLAALLAQSGIDLRHADTRTISIVKGRWLELGKVID